MSIERRIDKMNKHAAPKFAMSFTQDAVCLELRQGTDWRPLGEAPFANGDLAVRLNALRATEAGSDRGETMDTVLVIPDDQVLYVTLPVASASDTLSEVSSALERMTPYSADELAFDWCRDADGEGLRVAAVARRTLEEAEEFAIAQGFQPSGFIARPGDDRFDGQPDFGPSALSYRKQPRRPFSDSELHQVEVAPVVEVAVEATPEPAAAKVLPAVVISRIVPHFVTVAPVAKPVAEAKSVIAPVVEVEPPAAAPVPPKQEIINVEDAAETKAVAPVVIRHGDRGAVAATRTEPRIDPRARALHERAAEGRATRAAAASAPIAEGGSSGAVASVIARRPGAFSMLLGLLVIGLLLVLLVFGGDNDGEQIAAPTPTETPVTVTAEDATVTPEAVDEPAPQDVASDPVPASTPVPAEVAPVEAPETADVQPQPFETAPLPNPVESTTVADPVAPPVAPIPTAEAPAVTPSQPVADVAATPGTDSAAATAPVAAPIPSPVTGQTAPTEVPVEDALTAALREAMGTGAAATAVQPATAAPTAPATAPAAPSPAPVASVPAPASGLSASVRPRAAPVRAQAPVADRSPSVPANPRPAAATTTRPAVAATTPTPSVSATRPQARPASAPRPSTAAAPTPAAAQPAAQPAARPAIGSSPRPPSRPARSGMLDEGSAPEFAERAAPTDEEILQAKALLRDLRTAQAGNNGLSAAERGALIVLADARPARKPVDVSRPSQAAVSDAVAAAVASSDRPGTRAAQSPSPAPAAAGRPAPRPSSVAGRGGAATGAGPGSPSLASSAINDAVASAVSSTAATARPGAVSLTALGSSALPPRRSSRAPQVAASAPIASLAPTSQDATRVAAAATTAPISTPPAQAQPTAAQQQAAQDAALAEQRRQDAELQAQAEARARARAAADAQAEAQARAQAEARARAQADAEARAARSRQQTYTPPEAETEPEVAAATPQGGQTPKSVAEAATVNGGIQINRTQIIGTVGAGKASRALVRLSNGRIITLRLGDKINGGTITEIGDSKIVFTKGGRPHQLSVLGGQ